MVSERLRILVVDDQRLYRRVIADVLMEEPTVQVVGTAENGRTALEKIEELKPDLVTLDIEMPEIDGIEVLREIKARGLPVAAIMLSGHTARGATTTVEALELGAFDFILKPTGGSADESKQLLRDELYPKVKAYAESQRSKSARRSVASRPAPAAPSTGDSSTESVRRVRRKRVEVAVLGISTGGPAALSDLMPRLPADLAVPLLIVQHMPPLFTKTLAASLDACSPLTVVEGEDLQEIQPGHAYIAPGGKHMKLLRSGDSLQIRLTDDPKECGCRPAVDYLFRSASLVCGGNTVATIMTGMGNDGTVGCRLLKRKGASIIAQDEDSCVVFGMPRAIVEEKIADAVAPPSGIAAEIIARVGQQGVPCR